MTRLASRFANGSPSLRSDVPLSDGQIQAIAPSIFAEYSHESRSNRYRFIPTSFVLNKLRGEGFEPFFVGQTRCRDANHREFTKHIIRLRREDAITAEGANEVILLNSHNGTSSYQMLGGFIRFVCMNSLVTCENGVDIRVKHKGNDIAQDVIEGTYSVVEKFAQIDDSRAQMQALTLSRPEAEVFANAALLAKYDSPDKAPLRADQILTPRRYDDADNSLWNVYNRVQENLIQGGLTGRGSNGRPRQTRAVTGIDADLKLNKALWALAVGMKDLKLAA